MQIQQARMMLHFYSLPCVGHTLISLYLSPQATLTDKRKSFFKHLPAIEIKINIPTFA